MYDTKIYAYEFIPRHKKRDPKVSFLFIQFLGQGAIDSRRLREVTV